MGNNSPKQAIYNEISILLCVSNAVIIINKTVIFNFLSNVCEYTKILEQNSILKPLSQRYIDECGVTKGF